MQTKLGSRFGPLLLSTGQIVDYTSPNWKCRNNYTYTITYYYTTKFCRASILALSLFIPSVTSGKIMYWLCCLLQMKIRQYIFFFKNFYYSNGFNSFLNLKCPFANEGFLSKTILLYIVYNKYARIFESVNCKETYRSDLLWNKISVVAVV